MEGIGEWRPIDPAPTSPAPAGAADRPKELVVTWRALLAGLAVVAAVGAAGLAWWTSASPAAPALTVDRSATEDAPPEEVAAADPFILIDIQGAVMEPGLHRLPAGSRVGDAIADAGGYNPQIDIAAAALALNLAERLEDGGKVVVPARGQDVPLSTPVAPAGEGTGDQPGNGLIDINHASQAQLETLPGIGPVYAGKIIAAREEAPFTTVDELLSRGVLGPATTDSIRPLITVTP
jgi:competence protein ComEA